MDHHRLGAGGERLEHRHGRAHAIEPGDIAGGRDDAAPATAADHRPVADRRVVALLDAGIEGIAVEMGDRQAAELGVADMPGRATGRAAAGSRSWPSARLTYPTAVPAKATHGVLLPLPCRLPGP